MKNVDAKIFGYISAGATLVAGIVQLLKIPFDYGEAAASLDADAGVAKVEKLMGEYGGILKVGTIVSLVGLGFTMSYYYYRYTKSKDTEKKAMLWIMYLMSVMAIGLLYLLARTELKTMGKDFVTPYLSPFLNLGMGSLGLISLFWGVPSGVFLNERITNSIVKISKVAYLRPVATSLAKTGPYALPAIFAISGGAQVFYLWVVKASATKELD